ncbi:MAG: SRPBCC family protein [Acidimicrobiales bacterium]|nr:SRPBCC family protein [Acidimicrobiales bacterium]
MDDVLSTPVRSSVVVDAPIDRAFAVFTEDLSSWWPPEHHILEGELADMVFEPRIGGHVYDRGVDGSECRWARVLAYDPPNRVLISWDISLQWQRETDPEKTSEVEVLFVSESPERTRVELEHRNIHRHGEGWETMHSAVGSPDGWAVGLARFATRLQGASTPNAS